MTLTEEQKRIVRSTAPILKENGKEITSIFYKHMFQNHPELLDIFNQTNQKVGTQPLALANTVYFAAENIDHLDVLLPQVMLIAHKHRALTVRADQYPVVGKHLLLAIKEFLGDKATDEILEAWAAAYDIIAKIFIDAEKALYDSLGPEERDKGFVSFTIVRKEKIADGPIVAVDLERNDGGKMLSYHPGQYITVRISKDGHYHNRHYTLIEPFDGQTYRIAIKEENEHDPHGVVSTEIIERHKVGDTLLVSLPAGTFKLIDNAEHHLFISGGIGVTVVAALIEELNRSNQIDKATVIQCVSKRERAAFAEKLSKTLNNGQYHLLCGRQSLDENAIKNVLKPKTEVYICGSGAFMESVEALLEKLEHPSSQIHTEAFQPALSVIRGAVKNQSSTKTL